ncbi:TetR/AcrR family transcriptional regulator [Kitasatospora griseola]
MERADAARNRAAVPAAAARLFAEHGVDVVPMDQAATAAGVGKGTPFRRFGDRSGPAVALLDARERELQDGILHGRRRSVRAGRRRSAQPRSSRRT